MIYLTINDRGFVVSSIFCSDIRSALGTALNGRPKEEYLDWAKLAFQLNIGFGQVATDLPGSAIKQLFETFDCPQYRGIIWVLSFETN